MSDRVERYVYPGPRSNHPASPTVLRPNTGSALGKSYSMRLRTERYGRSNLLQVGLIEKWAWRYAWWNQILSGPLSFAGAATGYLLVPPLK
jgi:hypothetical protein